MQHLVWALWNLILSIAGIVLAMMMGIRLLVQSKRDRRVDEGDERADAYCTREEYGEDEETEEKAKYKRLLMVIAVPALALVATVLFVLTQDMSQLMVMADWWTIAHVLLLAGGILSYILAFKRESGRTESDDINADEENLQQKAN